MSQAASTSPSPPSSTGPASLPSLPSPSSRRVCQLICPESWVGSTISSALAAGAQGSHWQLRAEDGLAPVTDLGHYDALWISPGLLIAHQSWLQEQNRSPVQSGQELKLPAPPPDWLTHLATIAPDLTGRTVVVAPAGEILSWQDWPADLGLEPWSQLAQGRVSAFRAARRSLGRLQSDLRQAPADSLIQLSSLVPAISEEWRVVLSAGQPVASSGYCIHSPAGSDQIVSVFDGASFESAHRQAAEETARQAAAATGLQYATLDLAFVADTLASSSSASGSDSSPEATASGASMRNAQPIVLEANSLWCAAAYDYGPEGMEAFLDALQVSESAQPASGAAESLWQPDPWMVREFSRRYSSYLPKSSSDS